MRPHSTARGWRRIVAIVATAAIALVGSVVLSAPASAVKVSPYFPDVTSTNTFYKHISWLRDAGITSGYGDGTFGPSDSVTRGQMAAFLYKLAGSPPFAPSGQQFPDVPASHTFYKHISWLADQGITSGYANGDFGPADQVTRGQMATFLYKFAEAPSYSAPSSSPFTDVSTQNVFYKHINWLYSEGITSGYASGGFGPSDEVTRGQMAAFLYKVAGSPAYTPPSPVAAPEPEPDPVSTTDPRYPYCKDLPSGYGPYFKGIDPEYYWYTDADGDGVVCE